MAIEICYHFYQFHVSTAYMQSDCTFYQFPYGSDIEFDCIWPIPTPLFLCTKFPGSWGPAKGGPGALPRVPGGRKSGSEGSPKGLPGLFQGSPDVRNGARITKKDKIR